MLLPFCAGLKSLNCANINVKYVIFIKEERILLQLLKIRVKKGSVVKFDGDLIVTLGE